MLEASAPTHSCGSERQMTALGECEPQSKLGWRGWVAVVPIAVGAAVLLGWFLDIGLLRSVLPDWPSMKPNTALGFVAVGSALWATDRPRWTARRVTLVGLAA